MKRHWTVAIGVLIGLLVIGQVVTVRYAVAAGTSKNLAEARTAILAAQAALDEATRSYEAEAATLNAITKMPLTGTEHQMVTMMTQSVVTQKAALGAEGSCLKALQDIWQAGHEGNNR